MNRMYQMLGISKQAHFKSRVHANGRQLAEQQVISEASSVRKDHPGMGCRKMYRLAADNVPVGRDRFESILLENGFRVRFPRNYVKTTRSVKDLYFDNLINGKKINKINELWQSDIAYIHAGGRFYYLVFIMDVYSRRILGYQVHPHMLATANIRALKQAIKTRGNTVLRGLIHHSDRGGQYIDKDYQKLLAAHQITPSMAKNCWENAYVERVNGIMKNEYLIPKETGNLVQLKKALRRSVDLYNYIRPHNSLPGNLPPAVYEEQLVKGKILPETMTIYNAKLVTNPFLSTSNKK